MSNNYSKDPNWKWLVQHVIVPIVVAFIAGGAGTAVMVTIWNTQPATPTPQSTPTSVVSVSENSNLSSTPTLTLHSPTPTYTLLPRSPSPTSVQSTSTRSSQVRQELDKLLGVDRWFCVSFRSDEIGIKKTPANFVVQAPIANIEIDGVSYHENDLVPDDKSGTAWLDTDIDQHDCPNAVDRMSIQEPPTKQSIDALLGLNNWTCFPDILNAIRIKNIPPEFRVNHPLGVVDKDGEKYGESEFVPASGPATGWLQGLLSPDDCQ